MRGSVIPHCKITEHLSAVDESELLNPNFWETYCFSVLLALFSLWNGTRQLYFVLFSLSHCVALIGSGTPYLDQAALKFSWIS